MYGIGGCEERERGTVDSRGTELWRH